MSIFRISQETKDLVNDLSDKIFKRSGVSYPADNLVRWAIADADENFEEFGQRHRLFRKKLAVGDTVGYGKFDGLLEYGAPMEIKEIFELRGRELARVAYDGVELTFLLCDLKEDEPFEDDDDHEGLEGDERADFVRAVNKGEKTPIIDE